MAEDDVGVATKKIDALERERDALASEIEGRKEDIKKATVEIEGLLEDGATNRKRLAVMKKKLTTTRDAQKLAESLVARMPDYETEIARLKNVSTKTTSDTEEARREIAEIKRALEEKESRVMLLEREVEGLKQENTENEMKARDLERRIGVLEMKEIEGKSKNIRVDDELREKIKEKERELRGFKNKIEELDSIADVGGSKLESWIEEKLSLEEAIKMSKEKERTLESDIFLLQEDIKEAKKIIKTLNEKTVDLNGVNGEVEEMRMMDGLNLQWPVVVAGSTGVFAVAAVVMRACFGKK